MKPLRAVHYDPARIEDLATVTAPPYDILTDADRERLASHPHSIVRVTLPQGEGDAKYEVAATLLGRWQKEGILRRRDRPGFWCYRESYEAGGKRHTMTGLVGLLRLDAEYRDVLPHEWTHAAPKADRLQLMRATLMDTEPIHLLYEDGTDAVNRIMEEATGGFRKAPLSLTDERGWHHELWPIETPEAISAIEQAMRPRRLYIADGHHRYQTACDFAAEMRQLTGAGNRVEPFDHKLVVVASLSDPGLTVHPTHRLVSGTKVKRAQVLAAVEALGDVEAHTLAGTDVERGAAAAALVAAARGPEGYAFGLYWGGGRFDLLRVPAERVPSEEVAGSETLARLDVTVLHDLVLPKAFGVTGTNAEKHLRYTREDAEAIGFVDGRQHDCSVLMNATRLEEVRRVADARQHMPQKSTYFMPKLRSGLLLSPLKEHWRVP